MATTGTRPSAGPARSPRKPSVRRPTHPAGSAGTNTGTAQALPAQQTETTPSEERKPTRNGGRGPLRRLGRLWSAVEGSNGRSSGSSYYLIVGATLALTAIGLMMVLSASAVESIANGFSPYSKLRQQAIYAVAGLVLMFILSRLSIRTLKLLAWPALGLGFALLLLVFSPLGVAVGGNRNWIEIGPLSGQPSEAAKLALALWMATVLARKAKLLHRWQHVLVPVVPVAAMAIVLVLLGHDLGTALILMLVVAAALFFAGAPLRMFAFALLAAIGAATLMTVNSANRMGRVQSWLRGECPPIEPGCYQSTNGVRALASGGWTGAGLGQSQQKWSWIPEAHNDFIFAIIGEELGLLGTLVVVTLFGILAVATVRVIMRHTDPFVRILSGSILAWIIGQAFVNIGMVTGLLPVIGVPLPFISYGGSALIFVLGGIGLILAFARKSPESVENHT